MNVQSSIIIPPPTPPQAENSADLHRSHEPIQPKVGGPDLADLALATPLALHGQINRDECVRRH